MSPGWISLRNCSCLPLTSGVSRKKPLKFPPGFASDATQPFATGSDSMSTPTIGTLLVALVTTSITDGLAAKMTSAPAVTS